MVEASLTLMYPMTSTCLPTSAETERIGNRGYTGSPTADTYRCADGWLATAANTPAQFRRLMKVLGLERLCEDARPSTWRHSTLAGGFVAASDLEYLRDQFRDAFAQDSGADGNALNAVGVPAARVRSWVNSWRRVRGR